MGLHLETVSLTFLFAFYNAYNAYNANDLSKILFCSQRFSWRGVNWGPLRPPVRSVLLLDCLSSSLNAIRYAIPFILLSFSSVLKSLTLSQSLLFFLLSLLFLSLLHFSTTLFFSLLFLNPFLFFIPLFPHGHEFDPNQKGRVILPYPIYNPQGISPQVVSIDFTFKSSLCFQR